MLFSYLLLIGTCVCLLCLCVCVWGGLLWMETLGLQRCVYPTAADEARTVKRLPSLHHVYIMSLCLCNRSFLRAFHLEGPSLRSASIYGVVIIKERVTPKLNSSSGIFQPCAHGRCQDTVWTGKAADIECVV